MEPGIVPMELGNAPKEQGIAPAGLDIAPPMQGIAPVELGIVPAEQGIEPIGQGIAHMGQGIAPMEQGIAPVKHGSTPMELCIAPERQGIVPLENIVGDKGRLVECVCVSVCVWARMCACCMLHDNLRGGARGGGLHGGPGRLYCLPGVSGGSVGQVVGQPGVGMIMACLLETMTYRDVLW